MVVVFSSSPFYLIQLWECVFELLELVMFSKSIAPKGPALTIHLKFSKVFLSIYFPPLKLFQLIILTVISLFSIES